ncbi:Uncharacterised protein [Legionella pneumophila]|nr:Uncharacterised protein [Legionella pneumophila]CZI63501.1 Uncharacterised protein [Legionella pneumophila]CZI78576.1 Uncharacterised protein [Legionella pneumophila]CZI91142.1 Uncharacterised protein [Legionella pneumophila]CZJ01724.1 Uncharacterised protein [Legionella pneumophila]
MPPDFNVGRALELLLKAKEAATSGEEVSKELKEELAILACPAESAMPLGKASSKTVSTA